MMTQRVLAFFYILLFLSRVEAATAPDFSVTDIDGKEWHLYSELAKGKVVVLDFFFVDCQPCRTWTPEVIKVHQDYGLDTGQVLVLGISDRDENDYIRQFEDTLGVSYPSCGADGGGRQVTLNYQSWFNFSGWPTYAVVCADKTIHWNVTRTEGLTVLRNILDSCLKVASGNPSLVNLPALQLYPNPATEHITLVCDCAMSTISLYNLLGEELELPIIHSGSKQWVGIQGIKPGTYLISVETDHASSYTQKILIK